MIERLKRRRAELKWSRDAEVAKESDYIGWQLRRLELKSSEYNRLNWNILWSWKERLELDGAIKALDDLIEELENEERGSNDDD